MQKKKIIERKHTHVEQTSKRCICGFTDCDEWIGNSNERQSNRQMQRSNKIIKEKSQKNFRKAWNKSPTTEREHRINLSNTLITSEIVYLSFQLNVSRLRLGSKFLFFILDSTNYFFRLVQLLYFSFIFLSLFVNKRRTLVTNNSIYITNRFAAYADVFTYRIKKFSISPINDSIFPPTFYYFPVQRETLFHSSILQLLFCILHMRHHTNSRYHAPCSRLSVSTVLIDNEKKMNKNNKKMISVIFKLKE